MNDIGRYETIRANGLDFEVLTAGEGDKLALCLHGFPEHAQSWRNQIPLLTGMGYRVWAPNQRGYGKTTKPPKLQDYSIENLMADAGALIDASGAKHVTLIAHDWGAIVAWHFAMREIRPLDKLVIMNVPHPAIYAKVVRDSSRQRRKSWYVAFFQLPYLPERFLARNNGRAVAGMFVTTAANKANFGKDALAVYRDQVGDPKTVHAMVNWYRAALTGGGFARQLKLGYPKIDVPTLMIWGENDLALEKETTYGTDAYVTDLRIKYLPGISHWVQQDAPEAVNAELASFLS
jgi:pimeloyl-ACP methyl ester carboxylesterase